MTLRERIGALAIYLVLAFVMLIALFPFWWMLVTSLKRPVDIFSGVALWYRVEPVVEIKVFYCFEGSTTTAVP